MWLRLKICKSEEYIRICKQKYQQTITWTHKKHHFRLIDNEQPARRDSDFTWTQYNDLPAFNKWLDGLLQRYPTILKEYVYGKSNEDRPLRAIRISYRDVCEANCCAIKTLMTISHYFFYHYFREIQAFSLNQPFMLENG